MEKLSQQAIAIFNKTPTPSPPKTDFSNDLNSIKQGYLKPNQDDYILKYPSNYLELIEDIHKSFGELDYKATSLASYIPPSTLIKLVERYNFNQTKGIQHLTDNKFLNYLISNGLAHRINKFIALDNNVSNKGIIMSRNSYSKTEQDPNLMHEISHYKFEHDSTYRNAATNYILQSLPSEKYAAIKTFLLIQNYFPAVHFKSIDVNGQKEIDKIVANEGFAYLKNDFKEIDQRQLQSKNDPKVFLSILKEMFGNPDNFNYDYTTTRTGQNSFYVMKISFGVNNSFYLYAPTNNLKDLDFMRISNDQTGMIKFNEKIYTYDPKTNKTTPYRHVIK